ncbi:hypothetical protein FHG87_025623, partial [Trinorchestia longiramus]
MTCRCAETFEDLDSVLQARLGFTGDCSQLHWDDRAVYRVERLRHSYRAPQLRVLTTDTGTYTWHGELRHVHVMVPLSVAMAPQ